VDEAWQNVARPTLGAPLEDLIEIQTRLATFGAQAEADDVQRIRDRLSSESGFVVSFQEPFAHVPEVSNVELMAVRVVAGEFVLDNRGPDPFTVLPGGGGAVTKMKYAGDHEEARYWLDPADLEYLQNPGGGSCTEVCTVTPETGVTGDPRVVLQLLEGDWVLLPGKEVCIWCLFNQYAAAGETTGMLYVYPLLPESVTAEGFTWIERWNAVHAPGPPPTPSMHINAPDGANSTQTQPMPNIRAWAFFNPAPNCRSGP
jgi:hypothetical protein